MEESLLGCEIDRWLENKSLADMEKWLTESNHQDSDIGTYVRFSREIGLDKIGKGPGNFLFGYQDTGEYQSRDESKT
jgi:hypothetical protein